MTLAETLVSLWQQALAEENDEVRLEGRAYRVRRTRGQQVRTFDFDYGDYLLTALEQNPTKSSRWAKMARKGHKIMQFNYQGHFFANVVDGQLNRYGIWRDLGLPD